ncbi:MAG: O-antigen ligase family protein, partial [Clostridia bacterium]
MFKEENLKKIFIILMILYPLFGIKFFYNSYFTLIQIGLIMILFIWLLAINKSSRKNIKWLILYEVLLIGYAILHHMNALNFTSLVPGNFNYSAIKEILYLIKLNIPIIFVYILFYLRLNKTEFIKIIKWWIILISGSIVITNILGISLGSYSDEL